MNIHITGGQQLSGEITPSGSKNSAVCLIPASLLFDRPITLENVPEITDVGRLIKILQKLGSKIDWNLETKQMTIDNSEVRFEDLDHTDLGNMKGTSLLWGPMLARFKKVEFKDLPGGCTLGVRPLDAHFDAFSKMGVTVHENTSNASMSAERVQSTTLWLTEMSPTATENVIMLATCVKGTTKIIGAASEPQVQDLCEFLTKAGVTIRGTGTSVLEIDGVERLNPVTHRIWSDHYEIATFLALSAVTGKNIVVRDPLPDLFGFIDHVFSLFGLNVLYENNTARIDPSSSFVVRTSGERKYLTVRAQPWPGLPVDLLPIFIPLALALPQGQILFHNWMYESGLFWTSELSKLGANIIMADPHRVIVTAGSQLSGAKLEAPYIIRAVVAMLMAALIAKGDTTILNGDALFRGHPHFDENLTRLGAKVTIEK